MPMWPGPSNCVPTCPNSAATYSTLPTSFWAPVGEPVWGIIRFQRRVPKVGMSAAYTLPSVATLPFFTRPNALSTISGLVRLGAPTRSSGPHSVGAHLSCKGSSLKSWASAAPHVVAVARSTAVRRVAIFLHALFLPLWSLAYYPLGEPG